MLNQSRCCAPQKSCFNDTYDDYEEVSESKYGFNTCRPSFKENLCNRIKRVQESSKILENVLDIASTLVKILTVVGIHECKANKALDVIIYAFMHFDEVAEHPGAKCKKRIRKEEFFNDLMRDCGMTKAEAKLTYSVVKCAFKAFYHKQIINRYDSEFVDECEWKNAANRTINAFAQSGASKSEVQLTGRRILCAFENYLCRLQAKRSGKQADNKKCMPRNFGPCSGMNNMYIQQGGGIDPCGSPSPPPCPMPPLAGELCCQVICPPGSNRQQIVCTDQCGRIFLKVDGNRINFDPHVMECEARRAASNYYPGAGDAGGMGFGGVCQRDSDSCDEKLAELCRQAEKQDICDDIGQVCDDDDEICESEDDGGKKDGDGGKKDGDGGDDDKLKKDDDGKKKGDSSKEKDDGGNAGDTADTTGADEKDKGQDDSGFKQSQFLTSDQIDADILEGAQLDGELSITVKIEERKGGHAMEVDMQGYCPDDGRVPPNITELKVIANQNKPLLFSCSPK